MNIEVWLKESFSEESLPKWTCPLCETGILQFNKERFSSTETEDSIGWHQDVDWEPYWIRYRFNGSLKCNECNELTSFIGTGYVDQVGYYDGHIQEYIQEYGDVFVPMYFNPPLNIFSISKKCPKEIKELIEDSFKFYWNDLASCGNKIRIALEVLMNKQNINKIVVQNGKRKKISLHKRIELFKAKKPEIAEFLLAIKWIGNAGSHIGKLEKIDILDAYRLLEHSINKLYDNDEDDLKKITKEINKRKGKRAR